MRTRLLALVLVPIVGVGVLGGGEAWRRANVAAHADAVVRQVTEASRMLQLRLAGANETFFAGALGAAARFGVDRSRLDAMMGMDVPARLGRDQREVDRIVAEIGDTGWLRPVVARLHAVRAHFDVEPTDVTAMLAGYARMRADVAAVTRRALLRAVSVSSGDATSPDLRRDLSMLTDADEATTAVAMQLESLAAILAPAVAGDGPRSLSEVRTSIVRLADAEARVADLALPSVARQWQRTAHSTAAVRVRSAAARIAALTPAQLPKLDLAVMVPLFRDGMATLDAYDRLAVQAASASRDAARRVHHEATWRLQLAIAVVLAIGVAALGLAFVVARSISRPLGSLARHAARVSTGDLSDPLPPDRGPRELAEVASTLGEVVDNLRLVERQVGTLASGALDDATLGRPVPGRLGALLNASVARLSHSIADRERLSSQLAYEASNDALTGLPNRTTAAGALRRGIARSLRRGRGVAVLVVELDAFKRVNDTHGHDAGDTVLRVVAERMQEGVRDGDVVARLGSDEFAVLVEGVSGCDDVRDLAERLVAVVSEPVAIGTASTRVGASVGVALGLDGTADADALLRDAGLAAGRAKAQGGGRVEWFDDAMYSEVVRAAVVEEGLRDALEHDDLLLHFQPVVTAELEPVGAEALLRWQSPSQGLIMPAGFIPVAEASDLIVDVGRWVLGKACARLVAWHDDPRVSRFDLAVNLSGRHLLSLTVLDDVRRALESTGADPSRLVIEITETVLLDNFLLAAEHLHRLRALGVRIAIDDFGTGYASLAHLRRLPADIIKLDRSLVVAAAGSPADERVVELVVGTAHALGMSIVAEGVETEDQLALVRRLGCDHVQGYLVARPGPEPAFLACAAPATGAVGAATDGVVA